MSRKVTDVILKAAIATGCLLLVAQIIYSTKFAPLNQQEPFSVADEGRASLARRVRDFPATYISSVHIDLTSPNHWVRIEWAGPSASKQKTGPFHCSPGKGDGCDCNDLEASQHDGSLCTPKGTWQVEGFNDFLSSSPNCKFVTWFHIPREIAIHSHKELPTYPASSGCIRIDAITAQLIHNNAVKGKTRIHIDGEWSPPRAVDDIAGYSPRIQYD